MDPDQTNPLQANSVDPESDLGPHCFWEQSDLGPHCLQK